MVDATKIKIVENGKEQIFEEGKGKVDSIEFDVIDNKILTIIFKEESKFEKKIIFLDNVLSIEYNEKSQ